MDPYKVLGLDRSASDDEVKAAYRRLAKKYHPDANPGDTVAEQKMKEINAAYDMIINHKEEINDFGSGYSQGQYGTGQQQYYGGFNPFSDYSNQTYTHDKVSVDQLFLFAEQYIAFGRYYSAIMILDQIPQLNRNAKWYYLRARANQGLGNRVATIENAEHACRLDPNNKEYSDYLNELKSRSYDYTQKKTTYQTPSFGLGRICLFCCLSNLLLRLCCGGYGRRV